MATPATNDATQTAMTFLDSLPEGRRKDEARQLHSMMSRLTGQDAVLWSSSIIGYGSVHYSYASGREGDTAAVGFSPRKGAITLYGLRGHEDTDELLNSLGPHKVGAGCVYVTALSKVDSDVLERLISLAYQRNMALSSASAGGPRTPRS